MVRISEVLKSVVFHSLIVVVFVVGVPFLSYDLAPEQPILTVEIVDTVPETNLDEGIEADALPEPEEPDEVEEQEEVETPTPPPDPEPPAPKPEPEPQAEPQAETESVETAEAVPEEPEPKPPTPQELEAPPPRPVRKSQEAETREEQKAQLTSKLKDLTERPDTLREADSEQTKRQTTEGKVADLIGQALNTPPKTLSDLGISEQDLLRSHLAQCWSPPPGAAGADSLIVDIIVRLDKGAEVLAVEIEDKSRMGADSTFRAAARAAQRAILDCSPLPLPLDKYETWKELPFSFNPRFITRS